MRKTRIGIVAAVIAMLAVIIPAGTAHAFTWIMFDNDGSRPVVHSGASGTNQGGGVWRYELWSEKINCSNTGGGTTCNSSAVSIRRDATWVDDGFVEVQRLNFDRTPVITFHNYNAPCGGGNDFVRYRAVRISDSVILDEGSLDVVDC